MLPVRLVPVAPEMAENKTLSGELCHCILPVCPASVRVAGWVPLQMDWLFPAFPPTDKGATVMAPDTELVVLP